MSERPILFSGPMIRAILAGTKTQTRRIVKLDAEATAYVNSFSGRIDTDQRVLSWCPYGAPGDRLWVRETWARTSDLPGEGPVVYRACGERGAWVGDGGGGRLWLHHGWTVGVTQHSDDGKWFGKPARWTPGIHMPRWASRITLEVTGVRVERLQEISEEDARAEGVSVTPPRLVHGHLASMSARENFYVLWHDINGDRAPWSANPWVWVVSFRRAEP